jgi:hypothetical protein
VGESVDADAAKSAGPEAASGSVQQSLARVGGRFLRSSHKIYSSVLITIVILILDEITIVI